MLFLLKRRWQTALAALLVLTAAGVGVRQLVASPPPLSFSAHTLSLGLLVWGCVLASDGLIHGALWLLLGERYLDRYRALAGVFRGQTAAALLAGALLAGAGEELVFRGLDDGPGYLLASAVVFGLLHHLPGRLWLFTPWSVWQGLLFAAALYWTGDLAVTMTAHFLHDTAGFLVFRYVNATGQPAPGPLP
jgi:Type II CAAX prenyl endopeptidase Rce1-like